MHLRHLSKAVLARISQILHCGTSYLICDQVKSIEMYVSMTTSEDYQLTSE